MNRFSHKVIGKVARLAYGIYLLHRHSMNWMPLQWMALANQDALQSHN